MGSPTAHTQQPPSAYGPDAERLGVVTASRADLRRPDGSPVRVLVVDDEPTLADLLSMALRYEGWEVRTAGDGLDRRAHRPRVPPGRRGARRDAARHRRPGGAAPAARRRPDVPVLFLTARDAVEDRVAGLTAGGDDYVTKPFSLEEVVARLRGLLRRAGWRRRARRAGLVVGDLTLDEDSHEVRRGGEPVELTATEFELLRFLMRNPRRVLSQGADPRPGVELRLRRPVQRRRALHLLPAQEDRRRPEPMIHTVRGAGYVLKPAA